MTVDRRVVPFRRWHYEWLAARETVDGVMLPSVDLGVLVQMEGASSWTGVVDGEPIACAGTLLQWPGRSVAWAYMTRSTGPHMRWVTREALAKLKDVKGRIELQVRADFEQGHRWARMLGFEMETPLKRAYGPFGEDMSEYVRFN